MNALSPSEGTPALNRIASALEGIRSALEVLSADVTARQAREAAMLEAQHQHLTTAYARALGEFNMADAALTRASGRSDSIDRWRQWANQCETDMYAVRDALETFEAAHPDLAGRADDEEPSHAQP